MAALTRCSRATRARSAERRFSTISLSASPSLVPFFLEPVTEDPNIHIWVIKTVGRPPAYELILKHGEQTRRSFSERFRFLDDFLAANKLGRKGDGDGQANLGVVGMGRRIAAIADTGRILAELMSADVAF